MNQLKSHLWFSKEETLLGSTNWTFERKKEFDTVLNQHWMLDNYDSCQMLEFLWWNDHLRNVLEMRILLKKYWQKTLSLDIDETLSATSTHWFWKLMEIFWNHEWLSPEQMVRKYYHTNSVPYRKDHPEVIAWMHQYREDNEFQKHIELIDGVREQYQKIHSEIIPISSYITARPDNVKSGTHVRLEDNQFPNHHRLILRPQPLDHIFSNLWKACVLDILYPYVNGIVDDNPNLVKMLPNRYEGYVFLYDKTSTPHNHINVHVSETLDDVRRNIEKVYW